MIFDVVCVLTSARGTRHDTARVTGRLTVSLDRADHHCFLLCARSHTHTRAKPVSKEKKKKKKKIEKRRERGEERKKTLPPSVLT